MKRTGAVALVVALAALLAQRAYLIFGVTIAPVYDESIYLLRARGASALLPTALDQHRARGVPWILRLVAGHATAGRVLFAVFGIAICVLAAGIGRRIFGPALGRIVAVALAASWVLATTSVLLLPDIPAALGVLIAFTLYFRDVVDRDGPAEPWRAALAIGITFAINPAHAALAGVAMAIDVLVMRRARLHLRAVLRALAAGLGPVLAYLGVIAAGGGNLLRYLGVPLAGARTLGAPIAHRSAGYQGYSQWFFTDDLFGPAVATMILIGVAVLLIGVLTDRGVRRHHAFPLLVWILVPLAGMSVLFHAEQRYLLSVIPAMFLAAAAPIAVLMRAGSRGVARVVLVGTAVAVALTITPQYGLTRARIDRYNDRYAYVERGGKELRALATSPCFVFSSEAPEVALASGCRVTPYCFLPGELSADTTCYDRAQLERAAPDYFIIQPGERPERQPPAIVEWITSHGVRVRALPPSAHGRGFEIWRPRATQP